MKSLKNAGRLVIAAVLSTVGVGMPSANRRAIAQPSSAEEQTIEEQAIEEQTILLCETEDTTARVYTQGSDIFMRAYDRQQRRVFLDDAPTVIEDLSEGSSYRNLLGDVDVLVAARGASRICSISVRDELDEDGRLLADNREYALPSNIEQAVRSAIAAEVDGNTTFELGDYNRQTWPDSCLGLAEPEEICAAVLTEGWQVEMIDASTQQTYLYRTNETGSAVRLDESS